MVQVEVLHALGDALDIVRHVRVDAPGQDLRGAGNAQHVHDGAIDQCIPADGQRQRVDRVVGADAQVLAQGLLGALAAQAPELGQEGFRLRRAQVVADLLDQLGILVGAGRVLEHKGLGLGGRLVDRRGLLARLLLDLLQPLGRFQHLDRLLGVGQGGGCGRGRRLAHVLQLLLDHLGRLAALDRRLALRVGHGGPLGFLGLVGLGLKLVLGQAGLFGAAFEVGAEPQAAGALRDGRQILNGQGFGVLGVERDLANAGLQARGMVGHQLLALQVDRLHGALQQGAVMLVAQLGLGRLGQVCVVLLGELQLLVAPAHRLRHGAHEFALVGALLGAQILLGLGLGLEDAGFLVLCALFLAGLDLGLLALLGLALVLGDRAHGAQLEVVELSAGAPDHVSAAVGVRLDQDRLAGRVLAIRVYRDPARSRGNAGCLKKDDGTVCWQLHPVMVGSRP